MIINHPRERTHLSHFKSTDKTFSNRLLRKQPDNRVKLRLRYAKSLPDGQLTSHWNSHCLRRLQSNHKSISDTLILSLNSPVLAIFQSHFMQLSVFCHAIVFPLYLFLSGFNWFLYSLQFFLSLSSSFMIIYFCNLFIRVNTPRSYTTQTVGWGSALPFNFLFIAVNTMVLFYGHVPLLTSKTDTLFHIISIWR